MMKRQWRDRRRGGGAGRCTGRRKRHDMAPTPFSCSFFRCVDLLRRLLRFLCPC